jgi:hypothetical protein
MGGNLMLAGAAADTKGREVGTAALGFPPHKRQKNVVARHFIALNGRLNFSRSYDTHVYRLAGCCASDLAEAGALPLQPCGQLLDSTAQQADPT